MVKLLALLAVSAHAAAISRATDAATWARLLERARLRPTTVSALTVGATEYEVSAVVLPVEAVAGQCPAEMSPRVSFYSARVVSGPGGEVYPARLTVQCAGTALTREEAALDMGSDGAVRDGSLCDPATGGLVSLDKAALTRAQKARLDALLEGAVRRLLD